jgi:hypothetical protein
MGSLLMKSVFALIDLLSFPLGVVQGWRGTRENASLILDFTLLCRTFSSLICFR